MCAGKERNADGQHNYKPNLIIFPITYVMNVVLNEYITSYHLF